MVLDCFSDIHKDSEQKNSPQAGCFFCSSPMLHATQVLSFVLFHDEIHQYNNIANILFVHIGIWFAQHLDPVGLDGLPVEYLAGDGRSAGLDRHNRSLHAMAFGAFFGHHFKRRLILGWYASRIEIHGGTASLDLDACISGGCYG
jgi:hypothetical protein